MTEHKTYAYLRVSTDDQTHDLQLDALRKYSPDITFQDTISGSKKSRPSLDSLMTLLQPGDTIVVWKLDRLGRSLTHLAQLIDHFQENDITFISATEAIDTSQPSGKLLFGVLATVAEFERNTIAQRTKAGLAAAKARGQKLGPPRKIHPKTVQTIKSHLNEGYLSMRQIAEKTSTSLTTVRRIAGTA